MKFARRYLLACICTLFCFYFAWAQFTCDAVTYGAPYVKDCFDLYNELPGGPTTSHIDIDAARSFVEPKFLSPAFAPVYDTLETEMVQLPKVWKKGQFC